MAESRWRQCALPCGEPLLRSTGLQADTRCVGVFEWAAVSAVARTATSAADEKPLWLGGEGTLASGADVMPLMLTPDELNPKMTLYYGVNQGNRLLLPAGKSLTGSDIASLRSACRDQMIYILDPTLDESVEFQDDRRDRDVARAAKKQLLQALTGVRSKFAAQLSLKEMDLRGVHEAVADVVEYIRTNSVAAAVLTEGRDPSHYLAEHSSNVFYLALVLGNAIRGYVQRARADAVSKSSRIPTPPLNLTPLALAALFQDVSLWPMEHLYRSCAPLTAEQREMVREHPDASAEMLPAGIPDLTIEAVRMHHENVDGSGYPYGLVGDEISLFAKILRICDAFDAATAVRIHARPKSPVRVLAEMTLGCYSRLYDPQLLKVFSHLVQPYPIGAKVKLSVGGYGVVVRHNKKDPFRPIIIIAFDEHGERIRKQDYIGPFDLAQTAEIQIQSFRGEDVSDLYNNETQANEPLVLNEFSTLFDSAYP